MRPIEKEQRDLEDLLEKRVKEGYSPALNGLISLQTSRIHKDLYGVVDDPDFASIMNRS